MKPDHSAARGASHKLPMGQLTQALLGSLSLYCLRKVGGDVDLFGSLGSQRMMEIGAAALNVVSSL